MQDAADPGRQETLSEALRQLRSALELLDSTDAPAHIGAHVDLAINELYTFMAGVSGGVAFTPVDRNAEPN